MRSKSSAGDCRALVNSSWSITTPTLALVAVSGMSQNHLFPGARRRYLPGFAFVEADAFEMAEDRKLSEPWMNHAQILLVAGKVAAAAGVQEERCLQGLRFAIFVPASDGHVLRIIRGFGDGPALANLGARGFGMIQQYLIEFRALNLE
jgi:hypothetical protein